MLIRRAGHPSSSVRDPNPVDADFRDTRRAGLSLLEVLVALAIFLFSLVALGQLVTLGNDRARDVEWLSEASMKAQRQMALVTAGAIGLTAVGDTKFDDDDAWSWSMTAEADNTPGLYRVTVTVSRARSDGSRFESTLNQFVLDPTLRGNTDGSATGTDDASSTTTGSSSSSSSSSTTGGK